MYRVIEPPCGFAGKFDHVDFAREDRQQALGFQARDHLPHTGVNTIAEPHVTQRLSTNIEFVGILPFAGSQLAAARKSRTF